MVVALVLVTLALVALRATGPTGFLDPDAYDPSGSRAVAELLRDGGVPVDRVGTVEEVEAAYAAGAVLVLPRPQALAPEELSRLSDLQARLLLVGAQDEALDELGLPAQTALPVQVEPRRPACELEVAVRAGAARLGGLTYEPNGGADTVGCYAASGRATLLELTGTEATLLGSGELLTNDALADDGNAALALGLLGDADRVVWLIPRPGRPLAETEQRPLGELVPDALRLGVLQLLVAAGVLALWQGRRLGRVVEEPLPVVVRAAEAVEGRSRLYRASGARDQAGQALRDGTRDRLARRLGLGPGADRAAVVQTTARRTGQQPGGLDALLYGAAPVDDAALVRLADDLRTLERSLTPVAPNREVAGP